jgi:uncharacterized RDD family membrane protein YckC
MDLSRAARADGVAADYAVLTPERVTLEYDVAGIGSRSAAALIDVAIQAATLFLLAILLAFFGRQVGLTTSSLERSGAAGLAFSVFAALIVLGVFAILFGYYILFEIVWNGQTPGKRALGLRVLQENGYPVRSGDAVVRNLVRVIDGPPFGAALGLTVMLFNERSRRLGDFAAGTIVVREGTRRAVSDLSAGAAQPAGSDDAAPVVLSPGDATLLRDFLVRREELAPEARERLAARLADSLAARYGLQARRNGSTTEVFLERLDAR